MTPYNQADTGKPFNYDKPQELTRITEQEKQAALDYLETLIADSRARLSEEN